MFGQEYIEIREKSRFHSLRSRQRRKTHGRVLSVNAFQEKAGRSQVDSLVFSLDKVLSLAELPTVATVPSASSMANSSRVVGLVLREAILLLALGIAIGVAFAAWAGRTAASLVYGMKPGDPLTLGAAVALLALVALAASYGPASRASRLQPMDALRED